MKKLIRPALYGKSSLFTCLLMLVICLLWEQGSAANQKKTVVLLETMPVPVVLEHSGWFLDELKVLGYTDGGNMNLIRLDAQGDRQRARDILENVLKETRPDLVVTNATLASQEAMPYLAKEKIPHLFFTVSDPVEAGLILEIGQATGTNITGKAYSLAQSAKIDNLLRFIGQLPLNRPIRFGIIHSSYPSSVSDVNALIAAADARDDVVFLPYMIPYKEIPAGKADMLAETNTGLAELEEKVDFWWQPVGPLGEMSEYAEMLRTGSSHMLAFGVTLESVKNYGALLYMSPDRERYGRETARLAHAILSGTDPGTIPPTPPADFILAFNLKTALKLNIVVPSEMFQLAGKHIYK